MKTAIGYGLGTGARGLSFDVGFIPRAIFLATDTTQFMTYYSEGTWCMRTNSLANSDSFIDGLRVVDTIVYLGSDARVNAAGVQYYWAAIGDDGSADFEIVRWMGNATNPRTVPFQTQKTPTEVIAKRDSTRTGVIKVTGGTTTASMDGSSPSQCITTFNTGNFVVTADNTVNEYSSAGGTGEGLDAIVLFSSTNKQTVSWSSGTSGQVIPTTVDPLFALIFRSDGTGGVGHFVTRDMKKTNACKPMTATALTQNLASLQPGGIVLGSSGTLRTGGFNAIVFGRNESVEYRPPAIIVKSKKGIYFPGRGTSAQVDCGNSDATLKFNGAHSISWMGIVWPEDSTPPSDMTFITRGVGPSSTANAYSFGLGALHRADLSWSSPQVMAIPNNQFDVTSPLDTCVWRTGHVLPYARVNHYTVTFDGTSKWKLFVNGKLSRTRDQILSVTGGTAHYTVWGMRPNTGHTFTNAQRMIALAGAVFNRELTMDECVAEYEVTALGSSGSNLVTSGVAERWDCSSLSGTSLPATINAANNGVLSASCAIVTL